MTLNENSTAPASPASTPDRLEGLGDAFHAVFSGLATGLRPPPPIDFTEWARQNIEFGPESPFPGKYNPDLFPFFQEPLASLQPDHPCREVVVKGSAQIGKTIVAQVFVGASLDLDPGPVMYAHPTIENGLRWVRTKWAPFVRGSAALRRIFPSDRTRDASNTTLYKERGDQRGHLLVTGANSPASLSMVSFPRQCQDDLSKWEMNDSGDPESQADKRSQAFEWAKILKISVPHLVGACRITKNFDRSTKKKWHVPCPGCETYQPLEWENFKESLHPDMDTSQAHFTCRSCGTVIEQHHREDIVTRGRWVAENPKSKIEGFYIWSAYSPLVSWARIAEDWLKALGDPEAEHTFMNDSAGLPYEQKGDAPPWKEIQARAGGYYVNQIPPDALILAIGADCQGDRVEWLLKGFGSNLRRWTIAHGVIEGHISEERTQKQLDALLKMKWTNCVGRTLPVDMLAIDANYNTEVVIDWCSRHPDNRVIAVRGGRSENIPALAIVQNPKYAGNRLRKNHRRFFNVGVSRLKAALYKHLEKTDPLERGFCGFPQGLEDEYYIQLCSERRVDRPVKGGFIEREWIKLPGVRNEVLDMELYAEAAARRLGWTQFNDVQWQNLAAERETPPAELQLDLLDPNMAKTIAGGRKIGVDDATALPEAELPPREAEEKPPVVARPKITVEEPADFTGTNTNTNTARGRRVRSKGINR